MTLGQHYLSVEASDIEIMTAENAISRNPNLTMLILLFLTIEFSGSPNKDNYDFTAQVCNHTTGESAAMIC